MMTSIASWVLTYLLHSTLLIAGVLALGRWLRHRPDIMSGVYKTALVGGIVTASVATLTGGGATTVDLQRGQLLAGVQVESPAPVVASLPYESVVIDDVDPLAEPIAPALVDTAYPEPVASAPLPTAAVPGWAWLCVAALVVGVAYGVLSVVFHAVVLSRRLRPHTVVTDGPLVTMLLRLRRLAGVRRHVALWVAPGATVPMAMGARHPRIVLPPRAATSLPAAQQHTMLAHELAHVFRHDPAWRLVALLVERGLFFQPLNRLVTRRIHECAEYLCDDFAARHTQQPLQLATCLTEIAGWVGPRGRVYAASAMAESSQLRGRVERLLAPPRRYRSAPWASLGLAGAMIGIVAFAPSVSRGNPHDPVDVQVVTNAADDATPRSIVIATEDGHAVVLASEPEAGALAEAGAPRATPPAATTRKDKRRAAKANRKAQRKVAKAMRQARRRGDAAPTDAELEAILMQARREAGQVLQTPGGQLRIEIREDGPTVLHLEGDMQRRIQSDVRRQILEAQRELEHAKAKMQREAQRQHREARERIRHMERERQRRGHRGDFNNPFAHAPRAPAPPAPPAKNPFRVAPAPPAPPAPPANPFGATPAPPPPPAVAPHLTPVGV